MKTILLSLLVSVLSGCNYEEENREYYFKTCLGEAPRTIELIDRCEAYAFPNGKKR